MTCRLVGGARNHSIQKLQVLNEHPVKLNVPLSTEQETHPRTGATAEMESAAQLNWQTLQIMRERNKTVRFCVARILSMGSAEVISYASWYYVTLAYKCTYGRCKRMESGLANPAWNCEYRTPAKTRQVPKWRFWRPCGNVRLVWLR